MIRQCIIALITVISFFAFPELQADNNFSKLLLELDPVGTEPVQFTNPRAGWVWFKTAPAVSELQLSGQERRKVLLGDGEGFAELPAGHYSLTGAAKQMLLIRSVPEIIFYKFTGKFNLPKEISCEIPEDKRYGHIGMYMYHWNYLSEHILPNFNVVVNHYLADWPELEKWRAMGKKIVSAEEMVNPPDKLAENWSNILTHNHTQGIAIDEFVVPIFKGNGHDTKYNYIPGRGFDPVTLDAVRKVAKEAQLRGGRFYAWLGLNWNSDAQNVKPLYDALLPSGGRIMWECYVTSRNPEKELDLRLTSRLSQFLKADPNIFKSMIAGVGTFEFLDVNPEYDFKVWLDTQVHILATDKRCDGIAGMTMWVTYYMSPEILRYYSALMRHYCLLGNTDMLSSHYGFRLLPGIVADPAWKQGLAQWTAEPAQKDSIGFKSREELGVNGPNYPRADNHLLVMKHIPGEVNRISQQLKNLKPGTLYRLTMLISTTTPNEKKEKYPATIDISNSTKTNTLLRVMESFESNDKYCWNAYDIVFRYNGPKPAILTISDEWDKSIQPENVKVDALLVDAVQIVPYFSDEQ